MADDNAWRVIAASVSVLFVITLLLSTPTMIFAKSVGVLDTELRQSGGDPQRVLARMDLGDQATLNSIPKKLGVWNTTRENDWDTAADILNTNVLISRDYSHPRLLQSVNLLVIESKNVSSFHPAPVCYQAQGFTVADDGGSVIQVAVPNATWAQPRWLSDAEPRVFSGTMNAKLLEATKNTTNGPEKRVALYVYLKGQDWTVTRDVTWIRAEMVVPIDTPTTDAAPILSDLLGEAIPHVFSFQDGEDPTLGERIVERWGWIGWVGIVGAVVAPAGMLARPSWRRK